MATQRDFPSFSLCRAQIVCHVTFNAIYFHFISTAWASRFVYDSFRRRMFRLSKSFFSDDLRLEDCESRKVLLRKICLKMLANAEWCARLCIMNGGINTFIWTPLPFAKFLRFQKALSVHLHQSETNSRLPFRLFQTKRFALIARIVRNYASPQRPYYFTIICAFHAIISIFTPTAKRRRKKFSFLR